MYNSHNIATNIKNVAKTKNVIIKDMLTELGLGSNSMSSMYHGKMPASDSLAKIADYLDVSVDYLLGRPEKGLNEDENNLITAYRQSSMDTKKAARAVLGLKEA